MYKLRMAIHRGTFSSRDICEPREFKTEKETMSIFNSDKKDYERLGCKIWYAYITNPVGEETLLEENSYI